MEPHSVELSESLFFTARTVTLPLASSSFGYSERIHDEMNPKSESSTSSSALSSSGYSTRICDLMKMKSESGMSKEDAEIEASKFHWTETVYHTAPMSACSESPEELLEAEKLYKENVEVMKSLQSEDPTGRFFQIGGKVSGRKIGEGGQAAVHDDGLRDLFRERWGDEEGDGKWPMVLKVFKAGYSLRDLQKLWPVEALFHKPCWLVENYSGINPIWGGRLLEDGRFAFEMVRFWGDLRKLLDARLINNGNHHPPLMMLNGDYLECCILDLMYRIAEGMKGLHDYGILHRDLKASNVLLRRKGFPVNLELDPLELNHAFHCTVADYECSIGIAGTGFWRAPEILDAVKNQTVYTTPNLFTTKTDVYSYAMTCYEILTGLVPFEHVDDYGTRNEDVIGGKRPTLPKHLKPWIEDCLHKCWHANPLERPSGEEILEILSEGHYNNRVHGGSSYFVDHDFRDNESE